MCRVDFRHAPAAALPPPVGRGRDGAAGWRGAIRLDCPHAPATVAPPGDRQSPTSTGDPGRQPAEAPSPPGARQT
eukprot:4131186-Prymnesium_polylepis.1